MLKSIASLIMSSILAASCLAHAGTVRINEVVSSNSLTLADQDGDYSDWLELRNTGASAADLSLWGLSDDPAVPFKWVFAAGTSIPSGGYLLVWASGKNRVNPSAQLHTNFSISAAGETVVLTDPAAVTADQVIVPALPANIAYGRKTTGDDFFYFETATPGVPNATSGYADLMAPPAFTHEAGFYAGAINLGLSVPAGRTIYYTLDCSDPDPARLNGGATLNRMTRVYASAIPVASRVGQNNVFSHFPTTGILPAWFKAWQPASGKVFKATVVRARAYEPATGRFSKTVTKTYFVDPNMATRYGSMPLVSLVSDYRNLFDERYGIYVPGTTHGGVMAQQNFFKGWVEPASLEYFESNGTRGFAGDYEISNQGSTSPASVQKGLNVIAREELGSSSINYPLFAGTNSRAANLTGFKRFVLRSWGSARNDTVIFSDAYQQAVAESVGLETQAYKPAIVFINGEYWGLHEIRESNKNSWYHEAHTGIDRDDPGYDLLDGSGATVDEGDAVHWNATMAYINSHNMADDATLDYINTRIDVENFFNYVAHCLYMGKRDWPDQNESKWRPRTADGRWRWIQYDMDQGLNDFGKPEFDMWPQTLAGIPNYGPHPLLVKLLQNPRFKAMFINTYIDWLNSRAPAWLEQQRFESMKAALDPYITEYVQRWPGSMDWNNGANYARNILVRRNGVRRNQLRNAFSLGGDRLMTLSTDPAMGSIRCNRLLIGQDTPNATGTGYPWIGAFFQNQPATLEAVPKEGYRFAGWQVKVDGVPLAPVGGDPAWYSNAPVISFALTGTMEAQAVFEAAPPVAIHEWNFDAASNPLLPSHTKGGGILTITPAANAEIAASSQGFLSAHLRVNNPIGAAVRWALPTTGFKEVKLRYLTRRSGSGAGTQTVSYTTDGIAWQVKESYLVADGTPVAKTWDFSAISATADNPAFAVQVEFSAGSGGTVGNNRFDDVALSGLALPVVNPPPHQLSSLPDTRVVAGDLPLEIDLSAFFQAPAGETIAFQASASNPALNVSVQGTLLLISATAAGEGIVTVNVTTAAGASLPANFNVLMHPRAFPIGGGIFRFGEWPADSPAGTYPPSMIFTQSSVSDPVHGTPLGQAYAIPAADAADPADVDFPYAALGRTRINGLGSRGISMVNTGRGRDVGGAILALDTTGQHAIELSWTAGTETAGERIYGMTLQYRLDPAGGWTDVTDNGLPVSYTSQGAGDEIEFGPLRLPAAIEDHPYVQLQWRYHHLSGDSGPRSAVRLDNIVAWPAMDYQDWVAGNFSGEDAGDPAISGPGVAGGDGIKYLLKYALGISPAESVGERFSAAVAEDGGMTVRFFLDRRRSDVFYRLETSTDLLDWSTVAFDSRTRAGANSDGDFHEVTIPAGSGTRFVRLGVSRRGGP